VDDAHNEQPQFLVRRHPPPGALSQRGKRAKSNKANKDKGDQQAKIYLDVKREQCGERGGERKEAPYSELKDEPALDARAAPPNLEKTYS
jgi:hypothetical protein